MAAPNECLIDDHHGYCGQERHDEARRLSFSIEPDHATEIPDDDGTAVRPSTER